MPESENSKLKNDLGRELRSSSPAIKRPASVMGAQDREEHADTEMTDSTSSSAPLNKQVSDSKAKQQDTGERHRKDLVSHSIPHTGDPKSVSQQVSTDDSSTNTASESSTLSPTKSSAATSASNEPLVPPQEIPTIDEQIAKYVELTTKDLVEGQKGFVVSAKWLHRVQVRSSNPPENAARDKSALERIIGPVDNSDIAMVMEDSGKLKDEAGELFTPLRPGTGMPDDYEVVPTEVWDMIVAWHGMARTSPIITRYAHDLSPDATSLDVKWELNPPIFSLLKVTSNHTAQTQREKDEPPPRMLASRTMSFMEWLKAAKQLLNIALTTRVRVWKILENLPSSGASGMLTPAASRSASPAPGAEIVASAGDRMLIDVNTFVTLQKGEKRELVEHKDQTAVATYNGKMSLSMAGLTRDEVIALEEEMPDGKWPSDNLKIALGVGKTLNKSRGLTPNGRASPVLGMMTRGRSKKDGRLRGIRGLGNLGNTCYMNSALQCIRSVEELAQYFLHDEWKTDLNPNNPLGCHGEMAKSYANLIKTMYEEGAVGSFSPSSFKHTAGKYNSNFSSYQQQDSQEFLNFLLDAVHEDVNRITKKPYIEKPDSTDEMVEDYDALKQFADQNWSIYKARNDSVITDLFTGMYKSTVTCPVCSKVSIVFDTFNNLTLHLPIENNWARELLFFPLYTRPVRIDIDIDKNASIWDVKEYVAQRTGTDPNRLIIAEAYKHKFYKIFDNTISISEASIQSQDVICVYELDSIPTNYNPDKARKFSLYTSRESDDALVDESSPQADRLLVPVYNRLVKRSEGGRGPSRSFYGHPSYIVINRQDAASFDGVLKKVMASVMTMTTRSLLDTEGDDSRDESEAPEDSDTVIMNDDGSSSGPHAASIQGEDDVVDISMRDASQAPEQRVVASNHNMPRMLRPGAELSEQLRRLFKITVVVTGEGIPTGWSTIDEHKQFDDIEERVSKQPPYTTGSDDSTENASPASDSTSSEDVGDIPYEATTPATSSVSEMDTTGEPGAISGDDLPETAELLNPKSRNPRGKITYSRKEQRKQNKAQQNRERARRRSPVSRQQTKVSHGESNSLIRPGEAIVLDWDMDAYDALFNGSEADDDEMRGVSTMKSPELLLDEQLAAKRAQRTRRKKSGISIEDCLNEFGHPEILSEQNMWYCPRCKEHRRAEKRFELWRAPDILVMHLKRFSSTRNFRDKLDIKVDYPVEGLDMSGYIHDKGDGKGLLYDLFAVDMHYGGLGGGHYTAYAKNFFNQGWYEYNDSHVSPKSDPNTVVTTAAYLLFYRRRSDHPLGGPKLEKIMQEEQMAEADSEGRNSREASPVAGEGRRLGDSSHNGLSSAYPAGQPHLVGDGGVAAQRTNRGLLQGPEDHSKHRGTNENDKDMSLPSYSTSLNTPPQDQDTMLLDEDEGIGMDYPSATRNQEWSFANIGIKVPPGSEADAEEDLFSGQPQSSNSSTRVQGDDRSPPLSTGSDHDMMLHSESITGPDEFRRSRESAPPPGANDDDDDEELPVMELRPAAGGELEWNEGHA